MKPLDVYNILLKEYGHQGWWPVKDKDGKIKYSRKIQLTKEERLEIIIGAILVQNTSWKNVEKALYNLHEKKLINLQKLKKINKKELAETIRSSGYYNQKAEKLKAMVNFLEENNLEKLDVEEMRNKLLNLKGVGPETADSIILYAYHKPSFVVDLYTKRLFSRLGLIEQENSYDVVKQFFQNQLEEDANLFREYHALVVEHSKQFCKKNPICENCPLENKCEKNI
ncbi:MAG: endonuclease III domain-containing protein [Candidatus Aenigmatarchaeota archaeon]